MPTVLDMAGAGVSYGLGGGVINNRDVASKTMGPCSEGGWLADCQHPCHHRVAFQPLFVEPRPGDAARRDLRTTLVLVATARSLTRNLRVSAWVPVHVVRMLTLSLPCSPRHVRLAGPVDDRVFRRSCQRNCRQLPLPSLQLQRWRYAYAAAASAGAPLADEHPCTAPPSCSLSVSVSLCPPLSLDYARAFSLSLSLSLSLSVFLALPHSLSHSV